MCAQGKMHSERHLELLNWAIAIGCPEPESEDDDEDEGEYFEEEELLFNLLETKTSLDALALEAKLPISKVATILFQLEMKGCVRPLAGKQFERA